MVGGAILGNGAAGIFQQRTKLCPSFTLPALGWRKTWLLDRIRLTPTGLDEKKFTFKKKFKIFFPPD